MSDITRKCRITGKDFIIPEVEQAHLKTFGTLNKFIGESLPLPTVHPFEFMRILMAFSNSTNIYKSKSAISGKTQLTRINPELGYKIVTIEEFWSDEVDNTYFGQDYDFSKSFSQQWDELYHKVYVVPLNNSNSENCDYVNGCNNSKNCYLCFVAFSTQDSMYCHSIFNSNDCIDCYGVNGCQHCFDGLDLTNCYECFSCQDLRNSNTCIGCQDLIGCSKCIGCVGLRNVDYHVFNKKLSKEEYEDFISKLDLGSYKFRKEFIKKCRDFILSQNHKVNRFVNVENCVGGNYVKDSKNVYECYFTRFCEDCGYMSSAQSGKNCWRGITNNSQMSYQALPLSSSNVLNSHSIYDSDAVFYSMYIFNRCSECFGCICLKNKSYCILNKQYSKEEYFDLAPRIIEHMKETGEWGEFINPKVSPHSYWESGVDDWLDPIPKDEVETRGYRIDSVTLPGSYDVANIDSLLDNIKDVEIDSFIGKSYKCEETGLVFAFQKKELEFYKKFNIPLPRIHWRPRIKELISKRELISAV